MMGQGNHTAIITKVVVGKVDHIIDLTLTCSFKMKSSVCFLSFNMGEARKMMEETGCYDNINELIGKPCEIEIDDKNTCHFKGMWNED